MPLGADIDPAIKTSRLLDKLADEIARVDRVAFADGQVADLTGVRCGDDHFLYHILA